MSRHKAIELLKAVIKTQVKLFTVNGFWWVVDGKDSVFIKGLAAGSLTMLSEYMSYRN